MFRKNRPDDAKPAPENATSKPVFPIPPAEPVPSGAPQSPTGATPQSASPLTPRPRPSLNGGTPPIAQRTGAPSYHGNARTLVVGHGISIQGAIQDVERLVIEGTVEAKLIQSKEFIIAPGGIFRGTVEAEIAEIGGTLEGDLKATNSLTLQATGRMAGKAACHRLQVENGGQITGQLEMITTPPPGKAPLSPAKLKEDPVENQNS